MFPNHRAELIDMFNYSMSGYEKEKLRHIAEQTPEAFTRLGDVLQSDNGGLAELPGTLMGIYIRTL